MIAAIATWAPEKPATDAPRDWIVGRDDARRPARPSAVADYVQPRLALTMGYVTVGFAVVLGLLWLRVILESMIVLFHIAKSLASIDSKTIGRDAS